MAKVPVVFVFSLVLVMSIRTVIGAEAPDASGWNAVADKIGGMFSSDDDAADDKAKSPTRATVDQIQHAAAPTVHQIQQAATPTVHGMRGAAQAFASQASQAANTAKQETASWGDWFKHKFGAMNIFGGHNNEAPAMAPSA